MSSMIFCSSSSSTFISRLDLGKNLIELLLFWLSGVVSRVTSGHRLTLEWALLPPPSCPGTDWPEQPLHSCGTSSEPTCFMKKKKESDQRGPMVNGQLVWILLSDSDDGLLVLETAETFTVLQRLEKHLGQLLVLLGRLVLLASRKQTVIRLKATTSQASWAVQIKPVLHEHIDFGDEQSVGVLELFKQVQQTKFSPVVNQSINGGQRERWLPLGNLSCEASSSLASCSITFAISSFHCWEFFGDQKSIFIEFKSQRAKESPNATSLACFVQMSDTCNVKMVVVIYISVKLQCRIHFVLKNPE